MTDARDPVAGLGGDDAARAAEWAARNWYWFLIFGIIAVIFGAIVLGNLFDGAEALSFLIAVLLLYIGVVDLMTSASVRPRWMAVTAGILAIIGGVVAIVWPGAALVALAIIVGASFIAWGIARVVTAFSARHHNWGWSVLLGVVYVAAGLVAVFWPGVTILALTLVLGASAIVYGIYAIVEAFLLRGAGKALGGGASPAAP